LKREADAMRVVVELAAGAVRPTGVQMGDEVAFEVADDARAC